MFRIARAAYQEPQAPELGRTPPRVEEDPDQEGQGQVQEQETGAFQPAAHDHLVPAESDHVRRGEQRRGQGNHFLGGIEHGDLHGDRYGAQAQEDDQRQRLRAAVNTTIQGTAADLMKLAMLRVDERLSESGLEARILLQVHDELLLEVSETDVERVAGLVREAMEGVHPLAVPLVVDQKSGRTWLEAT